MIPTDWEIRQALQSIISAADTAAVVLPKFVLNLFTGENAALIKPSAGVSSGKIHGWLIDRGRQQNDRVGSVPQWDAADATSYRIDSQVHYRIWFFHYYALGSEGAGTDSTKLFNERLDAVIEALARKPRLGIATTGCAGGNQIRKHAELQVEIDPDIVQMGEDWAHFAQCRLVIDLFRTPAG